MDGMSMMIVNILQSLGVNPQDLINQANEFISGVKKSLNEFDEKLKRIDQRLENIEKALSIQADFSEEGEVSVALLEVKENEPV